MKPSNAFFTQIILPTLLVVCFGLFMTVLVNRVTEDQRQRTTDSVAQETAEHLTDVFASSMNATTGVKAFWLSNKDVTSEQFQAYASDVFDPKGALVALEWVDAANVVRYVYPLEGDNLKAVGLDNSRFPNRLAPILRAKEIRSAVMTQPIVLAQGFPGVVVYDPIYRGDEYLGAAVGVVRVSSMFSGFARDLPYTDYRIVFRAGDRALLPDGRAVYTVDGKRVTSQEGDTVADPSAPRVSVDEERRGITTFIADMPWQVFVAQKEAPLPPITWMSLLVSASVAILAALFLVELSRTREELERTASRERDFASLVSHQLRAPLTELNWMLDVAADEETPSDERTAAFDDMRKIVRQSVHTITELLHISRIERGVMDVRTEETTIATIIDDALMPLRETAKAKRVAFRIDAPPSLTADVDAGKVVEALRNIVDNAVKYGPADGAVAIAAKKTDGAVEITVADRGPGIPEAIRGSIFDKASAFSKKGTTDGAGLGLYLAKNLLALMGGAVRFETSPKGTTFIVTVPAGGGKKA